MTTETQATIEGLNKEIETCEFTYISIHKDDAKSILSILTKQANELDKLAKENEELKKIYRLDEPYSLYEILKGLTESAKILLYKKDYDGHEWERMESCYQKGIALMNELKKVDL